LKRIFLIVLDSFGIGAMEDAAAFGDAGANTLVSCAASDKLCIPNLTQAGLGNIDGVDSVTKVSVPQAAVARLKEQSAGKDTTIGHWEIAGVVSSNPLPTYPNGFPEEILQPFRQAVGRGVLANAPWSGTEVIARFGDEHVRTGDLIVYTSADSVFQIAAHEEVVPLQELYRCCKTARDLLQGKHGVGRVIARPFVGTSGNYTRTANRHDFSIAPPSQTMLDAIAQAGMTTVGIGKIHDIFAGCGITETVFTKSNEDGMAQTLQWAERDFRGLCFVNLVDFDMLYGHRRDADGYAQALSAFDSWLPQLLEKLGPEDAVMITADHGCDPSYAASTDHTREYVPLLILGEGIDPINLGTRNSFADIAASITQMLGVPYAGAGESFAEQII